MTTQPATGTAAITLRVVKTWIDYLPDGRAMEPKLAFRLEVNGAAVGSVSGIPATGDLASAKCGDVFRVVK